MLASLHRLGESVHAARALAGAAVIGANGTNGTNGTNNTNGTRINTNCQATH